MDNILALHTELRNKSYRHGDYHHFRISDPKPRDIHKASVRDRLLHHALHRQLYPFFDRTFIPDSYSCRIRKGTHKAMDRFRVFSYRVTKNHTRTAWVLKCDIRKFFASVDQKILMDSIRWYVQDSDVVWLIGQVVGSFNPGILDKGLPLGNLTSQLLVNVYMNEFDQFVKHNLKIKQYLRYADDFAVFSRDRAYLENILPAMREFLERKLKLTMHPDKIFIQTVASGVDFLGWVHFPNHRVLRGSTKRRMLRYLTENKYRDDMLQSYRGLLRFGNTKKLQLKIETDML